MKSTKTVLAVAIVIAGFAYAVGAGHPTLTDSLKHSHRCCGPQPEDFRRYYVHCPENCQAGFDIIPKAEGANGFVITDMITFTTQTQSRLRLFENDVELLQFNVSPAPLAINFTSGIPLIAGSTITANTSGGGDHWITLIGYVY